MCKHRKILFSPDKLPYAQGKRPKVDCILCSVRDAEVGVDRLVVYQEADFFVTLNLFPYNPGHLMIVPCRHTEDIAEFSQAQILRCHELQLIAMQVLRKMYTPKGFNLGYNMGQFSGASIAHIHMHVVPRYSSEVGFMDVINGARIIVESPEVTRERMRDLFESITLEESTL